MTPNKKTNKSSTPSLKRIYILIMLVFAFWALWQLKPAIVHHKNTPKIEDKIKDEIFYDESGKQIHRSVYEIQQGYKEAKNRQLVSHADCNNGFEGLKKNGCSDYIDSLIVTPPDIERTDFASGKSTAQCEAEVDAHWDPLINKVKERNDNEYAQSLDRSKWLSRNECANYDKARIVQVIHQPRVRVDELIGKMLKGFPVSEQEIADVKREVEVARQFPSDTARTGYLSQSEVFFGMIEGSRVRPVLNLNLSCTELKTKKKTLNQTVMQISLELEKFTDKRGTIIDQPGYNVKHAELMTTFGQINHIDQSGRAINCDL